MASIRVTQTITGLKSTVASAATEGSDFMALIDNARQLAADAVALVDELEHAVAQDLVRVWAEIGDATPSADAGHPLSSSDRNGFIRLVVQVVVPQEVAYNHRHPGSRGDRFVSHVMDGMATAFTDLPDNGAALMAAIGLLDAGVELTGGSTAVFFDGDPFDGV